MALPPGGGPVAAPAADGGGLQAGGARYPAQPPGQWPAWAPAPFPIGPPPAAGPGGGEVPGRRSPSPTVTLVVVGVAVVAVLAGVAVLGGLLGGDGEEDATAAGLTPPTPSAPAPPFLPGPERRPPGTLPPIGIEVDPEALARPLAEVLPEIIAVVEEVRGHRFVTPPEVQALSEDDFLARLGQAGGIAPVTAEEVAWLRATGVLPAGVDLEDARSAFLVDGVRGFYDPSSGDLVVRGEVATPFTQVVVAHELTHALDDQIFDLSRLDGLAGRPDESAFALRALAEGSARRVQEAYEERLSPAEQAAVQVEKLAIGGGGPTIDVDLVALLLLPQVPYGNGQRLVEALLAQGTVALDAAFRDPPTTSEQVLDPEVFTRREPEVPVADPVADGPEVGRGAFGAVDVRILELVADPGGVLLRADVALLLEGIMVLDPVDGFGGGRYVTWEAEGEACLRANLAGDDPAGAAALLELVGAWARALGGVEVAATGPATLSFTSCQ